MSKGHDRWDTVERLYHAALAKPADGRPAFLAAACVGDEALRREVESLLAQNASADGPFTRGAVVAAAGLVSDAGHSTLTGRQLGAYRILAPIGAGGMGEVYRARDTRLGRDVAIKLLPPAFTSHPDRLARLEREARVLASLNHPHIAAIYGIEDTLTGGGSSIRALILELVEGETLAERIARGGSKGLPLQDALDIARQIADALDAAHQKGIVHRDLKPANIKITPQGVVKVLDFGLAKLEDGRGENADGPTGAPTITVDATREGLIVGTAAYMSPEQARGQAIDKRTDIWAFGCVLYEMLTGRAAFAGGTVSDLIAAILEREPDLTRLPVGTPASIRRLLQRCFEKDVRRRRRDIADAGVEIEDALSFSEVAASEVLAKPKSRTPSGTSLWLLAVGAIVLAGVAYATGWFAWPRMGTPAPPVFDRVVRLVSTPAHEFGPVISPDGKWALDVSISDPPRVTLLPIGTGQAREVPLVGLEHVQNGAARFMPDGSHIVINANEQGHSVRGYLVDLSGGKPRPVTPEGIASLLVSPDGRYVTAQSADSSVVLCSVENGNAQKIPGMNSDDTAAQWSEDSSALYVYRSGEIPARIFLLDIRTGQRTLVREISPSERAGVISIAPITLSRNASRFAYSYYQNLSVLFVISGLK